MYFIYIWIKNVWWDRIFLVLFFIDLKVKYWGGGWLVFIELLVGWLEIGGFYVVVYCIMVMIMVEGNVFFFFLNWVKVYWWVKDKIDSSY